MASNTETTAPGRSPTTPSADIAFDLLKDAHRRLALAHLLETEEPVELTALAEHVAAGIAGSPDCVSTEDVDATCTLLRHSHLPRMEDAGVIEYDSDESTVTLMSQTEAFESVLSITVR